MGLGCPIAPGQLHCSKIDTLFQKAAQIRNGSERPWVSRVPTLHAEAPIWRYEPCVQECM